MTEKKSTVKSSPKSLAGDLMKVEKVLLGMSYNDNDKKIALFRALACTGQAIANLKKI